MPRFNSKIDLGDNVIIGMFSRLACIVSIQIGENTFTGSHIFISDYNHEYLDSDTPICFQGNSKGGQGVTIGRDCWIGTNAVICGNITIGNHVVIGACSFVNKSIPDYCVVAGVPARIIKKYIFETRQWEKCDGH